MDEPLPHIRFGYHGSLRAALRIAQAGGRQCDGISYHEYDITDPFRGLRGGELDVMIVKFTVREPDIRCSAPIGGDRRVAVLGARHPLAGRTSLSIEEVARFDSFQCPGTFPAYVWDEVVPPVTPSGRRIRRRHRLTGPDSVMRTVASTDAVHISVLSLADVASQEVRVIPIHDLPPAPVSLAVHRRDDRFAAFVAAVEATFGGDA